MCLSALRVSVNAWFVKSFVREKVRSGLVKVLAITAQGKILTCVYNLCDNLFNNFNLFLRSNLLHSETKKAFPVTEDQARVT